jgi:aspartyl-tRNA(Asn)/glutamyl-tRNA(Gln) amidotransferase subunit C
MKIDRDEAKRIADLAHLEFDDAGLEQMAGEMTKILSYIDQLREVDVAGFDESAPGEATPLRPDLPRPPVDRAAVAANAPAFSDDGHFVVPKVIGD